MRTNRSKPQFHCSRRPTEDRVLFREEMREFEDEFYKVARMASDKQWFVFMLRIFGIRWIDIEEDYGMNRSTAKGHFANLRNKSENARKFGNYTKGSGLSKRRDFNAPIIYEEE